MKVFLVAVATMTSSAPAEEKDPTLKPLVKKLKVASIDAKLGEISVREADFEVFWRKDSTRFYHHRSVQLKELKKGAAIHVLGKLHSPRRLQKKAPAEPDTMITDIEHIGSGGAFVEPPLTPANGLIRWHEGELLSVVAPFQVRIGQAEYRIQGAEKIPAYVLEKLAPEGVAGATVFIRGDAKKVTVERNGKERQVTRIHATEVHLVELTPEHSKVFQLQWGEKRKETPPEPEPAAAKGKEKGKKETPNLP